VTGAESLSLDLLSVTKPGEAPFLSASPPMTRAGKPQSQDRGSAALR
jgi:hypothetical protein